MGGERWRQKERQHERGKETGRGKNREKEVSQNETMSNVKILWSGSKFEL